MVLKVTGSNPVDHLIKYNVKKYFYFSYKNHWRKTVNRFFLWRVFLYKKTKKRINILLDKKQIDFMFKEKKRFLLFTLDFTKLLFQYNKITITTGLLLSIFGINDLNMRRNIILIKYILKFFKLNIVNSDYFYNFRPMCFRINLFMRRYNFKSDWYIFYVWRCRIKKHKRIKKWIKKKYIN